MVCIHKCIRVHGASCGYVHVPGMRWHGACCGSLIVQGQEDWAQMMRLTEQVIEANVAVQQLEYCEPEGRAGVCDSNSQHEVQHLRHQAS